MHDLIALQEQIDNTFNSLRLYEQLAGTSLKPELRLMYRRRASAEEKIAQQLQDQINALLQEGTKWIMINGN